MKGMALEAFPKVLPLNGMQMPLYPKTHALAYDMERREVLFNKVCLIWLPT